MEKDNRDDYYIKHILDAIVAIEKHMSAVNYEDFFENKLVQDAVIRELEIIGEASKRLSIDFKNCRQDIPWKEIAGMRDKLSHDYIDVDLTAVWETIKRDLPFLKSKLTIAEI
ncbi:MAG: DUF86 domain-containing protein [Patescibacteria group bacterium]